MENTVIENAIFYGKIGVDNLLLMLVGLLFFVLALLRRKDAAPDILRIALASGAFFCLYGFGNDLYRYKLLRPYLLINQNFQPFRTLIVLASLLPLYVCLIDSIVRLIYKRHSPEAS